MFVTACAVARTEVVVVSVVVWASVAEGAEVVVASSVVGGTDVADSVIVDVGALLVVVAEVVFGL